MRPLPSDTPIEYRARELRVAGKLPLQYAPSKMEEEVAAYDAKVAGEKGAK